MKTIYTLALSLLIGGSAFAQQANRTVSATPAEHVDAATAQKLKAVLARKKHNHEHSITLNNVNEFLGPTDGIMNGANGGITSYYITPIFCDSTVTTKNGTAAAQHVQAMKAGGMFDPKSGYYGSSALPSWEPYTIDTIWIAAQYNVRTSSANAKDTLQIELSWGYDTSSFYAALTSATPAQKWRLPQTSIATAAGNKSFSTSPAAYSIKLKHVLTVADTVTVGAGGANWPYIPVVPASPISVPANAIVGLEYTYVNKSAVPSNKVYHVSPTNTATMNSFFPFIGADTSGVAHNYFYDSTSWGTSATAYIQSRYGKWPTAQSFLNGVLTPETEEGYVWDFSITHTALITGVQSPAAELSGIVLYQNMPNPFNGTSEIRYELPASSDVLFSVMDLTGRKVSETQLGKMDAGMHAVTLQAGEFSKGIYFYTIQANGVAVSKKMVISE